VVIASNMGVLTPLVEFRMLEHARSGA
jgi:hypothetical protein